MGRTCMAARTVALTVTRRMEAHDHGREGGTERVHSVTRYPPSSLGFRLGLGLVVLSC